MISVPPPLRQGTLIPDIAEVELVSLGRVAGMIEMRLKTCRASVTCPECRTSSRDLRGSCPQGCSSSRAGCGPLAPVAQPE